MASLLIHFICFILGFIFCIWFVQWVTHDMCHMYIGLQITSKLCGAKTMCVIHPTRWYCANKGRHINSHTYTVAHAVYSALIGSVVCILW